MSPIHYVKSGKLSREQLNGKQLRWYKHNDPIDSVLRVEDPRPDGSFVLYSCGAWVQHPKTELERGHGHLYQTALDQTTFDKIEVASKSVHLHGFDFVIFENSQQAREWCAAKDQ